MSIPMPTPSSVPVPTPTSTPYSMPDSPYSPSSTPTASSCSYSITVMPGSSLSLTQNNTGNLRALVRDCNGNSIRNVHVQWQSLNPSIAKIIREDLSSGDSVVEILARDIGGTDIKVSYTGISAQSHIEVNPQPEPTPTPLPCPLCNAHNYIFDKQWGVWGGGNSEFIAPTDMIISSENIIYVADNNNNRMQKFYPDENFLLTWGSGGAAPGEFANDCAVALDTLGVVYVADYFNMRVQKFRPSF